MTARSIDARRLLTIVLLLLATLAAAPALAARAERVQGDCTLKRGLLATTLSEGAEVRGGDEITVGAAGEALIRISQKVMFVVRANSTVTFPEMGGDGPIVVRVLRGALRYASGAVPSGGARRFRLETPHTSAGVRGTDFEVLVVGAGDASPGVDEGTYVAVRHGSVEVADLVTGQSSIVDAGQQVVAIANTPQGLALAQRQRDPVLAQGRRRTETRRLAPERDPIAGLPPARPPAPAASATSTPLAGSWVLPLAASPIVRPATEGEALLDALQ